MALSLGGVAVGDPPSEPGNGQENYPPGVGYAYDHSGRCAGQWEGPDGSCTHADIGSVSSTTVDDTSAYATAYNNEVAQAATGYCNGDSIYKVRIIYATIQANTSRYSSLLSTLKEKAKKADYWLWSSAQQQSTTATRHFRYYCGSANDINISNETLTNAANNSFAQTKSELEAKGYNATTRIYLVFADYTENGNNNICGRGELQSDDSPGQTNLNNSGDHYAVVYLRACPNSWGTSTMHELGHTLGTTQMSAPHYDASNPGHPYDQNDVMSYLQSFTTCPASINWYRYDCNKDDYFDIRSPASRGTYLSSHWDIADSRFLVGSGYL